MGADQQIPTPAEAFAKEDLLQPQFSDYDNDFEKQIFFAINLVRHNPKTYGLAALNAGMTHVLAKKIKKGDLESFLKKCPPLPLVRYEDEALQAVRKNNEAIIALAEATPTKGGNITAYNEVIGSDKTSACEEYTMCQYMSDSAWEFVGIAMLLDWDRAGDLKGKTPILNKDVSRIGISNKSHPKTKNLIQVLYVKSTLNVLD